MLRVANSFHQFSTIDNINNNKLKGRGVMPHKDSPSDGQNTFSLNRHEYLKTIPNNNEIINSFNGCSADKFIGMQSKKMKCRKIANDEKIKKWYGNSTNKTASRIVETNKRTEIGKSSLNLDSKSSSLCFTNNNDNNLINRATIRVRRMGSAAPPKCNGIK
jgi:hypothetical protein